MRARRFPTRLLFGAFLACLAARRFPTRFLLGLAARRKTTRFYSGALGVGFLVGPTFALAGTPRPNSPSAARTRCLGGTHKVSWRHAKVSWRHAKVSWRHAKVSWRQPKVSWRHAKVSWRHPNAHWRHLKAHARRLSAWRPSTFWPSTFQFGTSSVGLAALHVSVWNVVCRPFGHPRFSLERRLSAFGPPRFSLERRLSAFGPPRFSLERRLSACHRCLGHLSGLTMWSAPQFFRRATNPRTAASPQSSPQSR